MNTQKKYKSTFNYQRKFTPNVKRGIEKHAANRKREELYSKNWDNIRKIVYTRDNHRCVMCGKKGKVHAHHIVPVRVSHDNSLSNLVTVCEKCHRKLETVGFTILEAGGSRTDVKRAELRMIAEARKIRLEKYNKLLQEKKKQQEKIDNERNDSHSEIRENREQPEIIDQGNCKIAI